MKTIAIFQEDLNIGGIQKSCVNLLNNIDTKKYQVDLYLVNKNNIFLKDLNEDIKVYYLKKLPFFARVMPFRLVKLFYNNHLTKEYDITIDFNTYSNETAIEAIRCKSKKKIAWIHNDFKEKQKEEIKFKIIHFMFKSKYKYFTSFYAVSQGALESFKSLHNYPNKEYVCLPNLIDTKEIKSKLSEKTEITINQDKINIGSVGRIVHQKGFDILVNEINNIKDSLDNYHFYIIGGGKEQMRIRKLIDDYNLNDMITMLGYQKNPYSILKQMDGFILTSRYEGQGMVFLETKCLDLDIIMPKHLEKYVEGIKGTDDIKKSLLNIKKRTHKFNDLKEYNKDIIDKINNL